MTMHAPEPYEIRVAGQLSDLWENQFEGLRIERTPEGHTILSGMLDQAGLHGILRQIRDLGLKVIAVQPTETDVNKQAVDTEKTIRT